MTEQSILALPVSPRFGPRAFGRQTFALARRYPVTAAAALVLIGFCVVALFAPFLAPYGQTEADGFESLAGPSRDHFFGTDRFGRDVFSRILYGTRISLGVGFVAVAIAGTIGLPLGLVGGFFGGIVDSLLMRLTDTFMAIPGLLLALTLVLVLEPSFLTVALALGIAAFPGYARVMRSRVLALRSADFVLAAHALGASNVRVMFRHILPNATAPMIVVASLSMGGAVLAEAGLSFLGVGVRPPTATWGSMLKDSFALIYTAPWLMLFPGVAIFVLILSLNLLGDGLRDLLDPRQRGS
ncbi:MAG: ABC transporter permease [Tepidiformaceae bacterium]